MEIWTLAIAMLIIVVSNFMSVFAGLATLRWMDRRQKMAIANIFMRELGEKLETEASFQDIVKNLLKEEREGKDSDDETR